jgi:hypothetical protein
VIARRTYGGGFGKCARKTGRPPQFAPRSTSAQRRLQSCLYEPFVECWIGVVDESDRRIVRLAGRLGEAQVPELLMACGEARRLELDLSDLLSADPTGLEALQRVQAHGATLVGVPGYIQLQLAAPSRIRKRGRLKP